MEDRLKRRIGEFASELAREQQQRLQAAGKFVDLELLTAEIGDQVARELSNIELSRRSQEAAREPVHACPDCGRECPVDEELEPIILQGMRGEIEYQEPRCFCSRCRRAFFPSGRNIGASPA